MENKKKVCLLCGSNKTYLSYGKYQNWFKYKDGSLCSKCYLNKYYQENKIKMRQQNNSYRKENPQIVKECKKRYREKNKQELLLKRKKYYELFPNKEVDRGRNVREKLRNQIFDIIGRQCIKCGFLDIRALQFDHINGDGYKESKKRGILGKTLRYLRDNPELCKQTLQTLCANCNTIKRFSKNESKKRGGN